MTSTVRDPQQPSDAAGPLRRIPVSELLRGAEEVIVVHQGQDYRLRLTKNGKLILTK